MATYADTGLLTISVGLDAKHLRAALGLIRREVDRLCAQPVGARELREARDYLVGQHRLGMESTTNQMMWLGESLLSHGRIARPEEAEEALAAVTPGGVQEAARASLQEGFRALVAVGPVEASGASCWVGSGRREGTAYRLNACCCSPPAMASNACKYFPLVRSMISVGRCGAGGVLSQGRVSR